MGFKKWLLENNVNTHPDADALYPPLYTGFMNYPPQVVVNWSADSIYYLDSRDVSCHPYSYTGKFRPYFWKGIYGGRGGAGE